MSSSHPLGMLVSWVGSGNSGTSQTIDFTTTPSGAPTDVTHEYVKMEELHLLGSIYQVDPYGSGPAPKLYTMTWTYKIISTLSSGAYAAVRTTYNTWIGKFDNVDGSGNSGQKGVLTAQIDAYGSSTVSCTARLSQIPLKITAQNTRYLALPLSFIILSNWA